MSNVRSHLQRILLPAARFLRIIPAMIACASYAPAAIAQELSPEQIRDGVARAGGLKSFLSAQAGRAAKASGQMLDSETQLMGSVAIDTTIVQYAKMVNVERGEINVNDARDVISKHNAAVVCTAPIARVLIGDLGAEYRYMFYSKSGVYLFHYSLTKATCSAYLKR